jgi:hypothetical protein
LGYNDANYIYSSNMLQIDEFVAFTVSGSAPPPPPTSTTTCQYQVSPQGPVNQPPVSLSSSNGTGDSWDSGSILWGGGSQVILYETSTTNPSQSFTWTQKSPGYTVCSDNAAHLCLSNSGGNLVQTQAGDTFQILAGSKPTTAYVLDVTHCGYIEPPSSSSGSDLVVGSAPADWVIN